MIIYTGNPFDELRRQAAGRRVAVVTDSNVAPLLAATDYDTIVIPAGEENKTLATVGEVWNRMVDLRLRRGDVVACVGGGVVTDLGGFCAATFKRGLPCINVPTTILGAVDAAVGGKTGFDFRGLKNEIGAFSMPEAVIVSDIFYATLPRRERLSGYGEMLKHALLDSPAAFARFTELTPDEVRLDDIRRSVALKERIVAADPREGGLRRILNLGHTVGHALEELLLEKGTPESHGACVARGIVAELANSRINAGLDSTVLYTTATLVRNFYGPMPATCADYPRLLELMAHDKKNRSADLLTLVELSAPGQATVADRPLAAATAMLDLAADLLS